MRETNPLLETHELPPFERIEASHVEPAIDELLGRSRSAIADIEGVTAPSWANTAEALEALQDALAQAWSPIGHLHGVADSDALRDAYNACLPKLSEFRTELGQNDRLFAAYETLRSSPEYESLPPARQKAINNTLRDFRLSGIDLPKAEQKRFAEVSKRLSELSAKFSENVLDATQAWSKTSPMRSSLQGCRTPPLALHGRWRRAKALMAGC